MKEYLKLVENQLEAYNSGDIEKFCQNYHQQVVVKKLHDTQVIVKDIEEFRELYSKLFQNFPNQKCSIKSRIMVNDSIIDEEMIMGRPTYPDGFHVVAIYSFRDNLIDRVCFV
ncbi:MAG: nuclear transport factor 2 family protein [Bacteriovoracaceae bacterium]